MHENKMIARVVGVLFIAATALAVIGDRLLRPIRDADDSLTSFATHEDRVILGMWTELLLGASVVAIAVALAPILRQRNPRLALGYVAARILEAAVIIAGGISSLMLFTLSENYVEGGAQNSPGFEPVAGVLLSVRDWTDALGPSIIFAMTALILYTALYQSQLVPRWLSVWGLVGAILLLVAGTLALYGESPTSTLSIVLTAPIGIQEMVLAGWLIVKGFADGDMTPSTADVRAGADSQGRAI
jgi:hypothetical protein